MRVRVCCINQILLPLYNILIHMIELAKLIEKHAEELHKKLHWDEVNIDDWDKFTDESKEKREVLATKEAILRLYIKSRICVNENTIDSWIDSIHEFEENTVDKLLHNITNEEFIDLCDELSEYEKTSWGFADLYNSLYDNDVRRPLGQFQTPEHPASIMGHWLDTDEDTTIVDIGSGTGVLSLPAIEYGSGTDITHIDVDSTQLLISKLNLIENTNKDIKINSINKDFLLYDNENKKATSYISNPPYTRKQDMNKSIKRRLKLWSNANLNIKLSEKTPLYIYIISKMALDMKTGERASIIIPAEFLNTNYGEQFKQILLEQFTIHGMVNYDEKNSAFEDALATSCILLLEKQPQISNDSYITTLLIDGSESPINVSKAITNPKESTIDNTREIKQNELKPKDKWRSLFGEELNIDTDSLIELRDISTSKRGISTGNHPFFCLTDEDVKEKYELEEETYSPIVRKAQHLNSLSLTFKNWSQLQESGKDVWVFDYDESTLPPNAKKYVEEGEENDVHTGYTTSNRPNWYGVDYREPPDIFFKYMSRTGEGRFVYNELEVKNLNNLHGIIFDDNISDEEIKALTLYLNSELADKLLQAKGRIYADGLSKLEPNELKEAPIIDIKSVDDESVNRLADIFEEYKDMQTLPKDIDEEVKLIIEESI